MCITAETLIYRRMPVITDIPPTLQQTFAKLGNLRFISKTRYNELDDNGVMITITFDKILYQQKHHIEVLRSLNDTHYQLTRLVWTLDNKTLLLFLKLR